MTKAARTPPCLGDTAVDIQHPCLDLEVPGDDGVGQRAQRKDGGWFAIDHQRGAVIEDAGQGAAGDIQDQDHAAGNHAGGRQLQRGLA
jgi:hypothetical protein